MSIEQMVLNLNADRVRPWGELTLVEKMDVIGGLLVPESWLENEWGSSPQNRTDYDCEATGWDVQKWTTAERSRIRKRRLYSGFANREILGASIDVASKLDNDSTNPSNLNITTTNTHHFGLAAAITEAIVAREWKKLVESGESVDQKLEVLGGRLFKRRIGETNIEAERKEI